MLRLGVSSPRTRACPWRRSLDLSQVRSFLYPHGCRQSASETAERWQMVLFLVYLMWPDGNSARPPIAASLRRSIARSPCDTERGTRKEEEAEKFALALAT